MSAGVGEGEGEGEAIQLTARVTIDGLDQLATEVDVGDDGVVAEVRANVAVRVGEVGGGGAPGGRVGLLGGDVAGDGVAGKLPHAHALVAPLEGHDAAAVAVEGVAKGVGAALDAAAGVIVGVVVAVGVLGVARLLAAHAHGAAAGRVQRHLVAGVALVGRLHDVNLAVVGPTIGVDEPQGRPGPAAKGAVLDVEEEEAAVVRLARGDADREAARRGVGLVARADGCVDLEHGRISRGRREVLWLCLSGGPGPSGCRKRAGMQTHQTHCLLARNVMDKPGGYIRVSNGEPFCQRMYVN